MNTLYKYLIAWTNDDQISETTIGVTNVMKTSFLLLIGFINLCSITLIYDSLND